jgi:hypothetical protein
VIVAQDRGERFATSGRWEELLDLRFRKLTQTDVGLEQEGNSCEELFLEKAAEATMGQVDT